MLPGNPRHFVPRSPIVTVSRRIQISPWKGLCDGIETDIYGHPGDSIIQAQDVYGVGWPFLCVSGCQLLTGSG
jgi:hypothetical protein